MEKAVDKVGFSKFTITAELGKTNHETQRTTNPFAEGSLDDYVSTTSAETYVNKETNQAFASYVTAGFSLNNSAALKSLNALNRQIAINARYGC